jgi:hypothetical protein
MWLLLPENCIVKVMGKKVTELGQDVCKVRDFCHEEQANFNKMAEDADRSESYRNYATGYANAYEYIGYTLNAIIDKYFPNP